MASMFKKGDKVNRNLLKRANFDLPELGEEKYLLLRALSAREVNERQVQEKQIRRDIVAANPTLPEAAINQRVVESMPAASGYALIAQCAINEDGTPVFTDVADCEANLDVAASSIVGIINAILALSGIPQDAGKN